jgi:hypothetical protein
MQENREILADRAKALCPHHLGRSANDNIIAILYRQTEQFVANGATDGKDFHA